MRTQCRCGFPARNKNVFIRFAMQFEKHHSQLLNYAIKTRPTVYLPEIWFGLDPITALPDHVQIKQLTTEYNGGWSAHHAEEPRVWRRRRIVVTRHRLGFNRDRESSCGFSTHHRNWLKVSGKDYVATSLFADKTRVIWQKGPCYAWIAINTSTTTRLCATILSTLWKHNLSFIPLLTVNTSNTTSRVSTGILNPLTWSHALQPFYTILQLNTHSVYVRGF